MGFFIRGFIWDIPILIFAYVLLRGPIVIVLARLLVEHVAKFFKEAGIRFGIITSQ